MSTASFSNAQKIEKYYTSLVSKDGTLFFIYPIKGFRSTENNNNFIYDITYSSIKDSVVLNFSYFDNLNLNIDSIIFINNNFKISNKAEIIFVEAQRRKLHYRYTTIVEFNDLKKFYEGDNPLIKLKAKQANIEIGMRKRAWKKHSSIISRILSLIELNK